MQITITRHGDARFKDSKESQNGADAVCNVSKCGYSIQHDMLTKMDFLVITTTLASSRWKSLEQINQAGRYAVENYPDVIWWDQNWRKGGLSERRIAIIKEYGFYNQQYCGCEFSMRKEESPSL